MSAIQLVCTVLGGVSSSIVIIVFWEKAYSELKRMFKR